MLAKILLISHVTRGEEVIFGYEGPLPEATPTECDRRTWSDSVGHGRIWSDLVGLGRNLSDLVRFGKGRIGQILSE